ncbi:MAG: hypothetical protein ACRDJW_16145 [Thermomicrobiales bacterium]
MTRFIDERGTTIAGGMAKRLIAASLAATLLLGGATGVGTAFAADEAEECEADRSNHLLGGLLTGPLTFISDLLPFTIAGEQHPVCEDDA